MAPGVEFADLNWLAIGLAVIVNMALGFLWYAPKTPTGRIWMREAKIEPELRPNTRQMVRAFSLAIIGAFLMMFVLQHTFIAYRDAYDLDAAGDGYKLSYVDGIVGAVMVWLAFFVPVLWSSIAWENKSWSLFFVNASYYLVTLLVAGLIYAAMLPA